MYSFDKEDTSSVNTYIFHFIKEKIKRMEEEHNIDIILAVESGSRMWGFASPDSGYDVRFIYKPRNILSGYSVSKIEDVISESILYPDDSNTPIDLVGWNIVKAVKLMRSGNATVIDWLGSDIVYTKCDRSVALLKMLQYYLLSFQPVRVRVAHHHRALANKCYREDLEKIASDGSIPAKKILYALRSAGILRHLVISGFESPIPIFSPHILSYYTDQHPLYPVVLNELKSLIYIKSKGGEKAVRIIPDNYPCLISILEKLSDLMDAIPESKDEQVDIDGCDAVIHSILSM